MLKLKVIWGQIYFNRCLLLVSFQYGDSRIASFKSGHTYTQWWNCVNCNRNWVLRKDNPLQFCIRHPLYDSQSFKMSQSRTGRFSYTPPGNELMVTFYNHCTSCLMSLRFVRCLVYQKAYSAYLELVTSLPTKFIFSFFNNSLLDNFDSDRLFTRIYCFPAGGRQVRGGILHQKKSSSRSTNCAESDVIYQQSKHQIFITASLF